MITQIGNNFGKLPGWRTRIWDQQAHASFYRIIKELNWNKNDAFEWNINQLKLRNFLIILPINATLKQLKSRLRHFNVKSRGEKGVSYLITDWRRSCSGIRIRLIACLFCSSGLTIDSPHNSIPVILTMLLGCLEFKLLKRKYGSLDFSFNETVASLWTPWFESSRWQEILKR